MKTISHYDLFGVFLGLSLINACLLEEHLHFDPCFKVLGNKFRCVKPRNCKTKDESSNSVFCGPNGIGICCNIISSVSPVGCGIRDPSKVHDNFHVPLNFKKDEYPEEINVSKSSSSSSITTLSSKISVSEIYSKQTPESLVTAASISDLPQTSVNNTSEISWTTSLDVHNSSLQVNTLEPVVADSTNCSNNTSQITDSKRAGTDDVHVSSEMAYRAHRNKRTMREAIYPSYLMLHSQEMEPEPMFEDNDESSKEKDPSSFENLGYRNLKHDDVFFPEKEDEIEEEPTYVVNSKHEVHYQNPEVRVVQIDKWPGRILNQVHIESMSRNNKIIRKRRQKTKQERFGGNPTALILQAFKQLIFRNLPTNKNRMQLINSNSNSSDTIYKKLFVISKTLSDYIVTGTIPTETTQFIHDVLDVILMYHGNEIACKIHPQIVEILNMQRNITCHHSLSRIFDDIGNKSVELKSANQPPESRQRELQEGHLKHSFIIRKQIITDSNPTKSVSEIKDDSKLLSEKKPRKVKTFTKINDVLESILEMLFQTSYVHKDLESGLKILDLNKNTGQSTSQSRGKMYTSFKREVKNISLGTKNITIRNIPRPASTHEQDSNIYRSISKSKISEPVTMTTKNLIQNIQKQSTIGRKINLKEFEEFKSQTSKVIEISSSRNLLIKKEKLSTKSDSNLRSVSGTFGRHFNIPMKTVTITDEIPWTNSQSSERNQQFKNKSDGSLRRKRNSELVCHEKELGTTGESVFSSKKLTDNSSKTEYIQEPIDVSAVESSKSNRQFIVGGKIEEQPWPWMVAIYFEPFNGFVCAGTLFDDQHIITAAHCFKNKMYRDPNRLVVTIGHLRRMDIAKDKEEVQYHRVKELFIHEDYFPACFCNDIAILRLSSPVGPDHIPACIPEQDPARTGQTVTTMGWGQTKYGEGGGSYLLQRIDDLVIVNGRQCRKKLTKISKVSMPKEFGEQFICAGVPGGEKDACIGDSGGPLMFEDYDGYWSVIGVVSFGYKCATPDVPGTYTRISYFLPWIANITQS